MPSFATYSYCALKSSTSCADTGKNSFRDHLSHRAHRDAGAGLCYMAVVCAGKPVTAGNRTEVLQAVAKNLKEGRIVKSNTRLAHGETAAVAATIECRQVQGALAAAR